MTTHAEILKSLAQNAINRIESSKRVLCSMPGVVDTSIIDMFYDLKIGSIQNFLKALSFSNEIDVELCELLDKADYTVTAEAINEEVKEFAVAFNQLHMFIISTPVDPANPAEDKMKVYHDQHWAMIEAKSDFYELYNKVRFH